MNASIKAIELFQSTPSARRATAAASAWQRAAAYFNPRPPRGGRQIWIINRRRAQKFQSTPSARRATETASPPTGAREISIHALREEGDWQEKLSARTLIFQSTPSARRATWVHLTHIYYKEISIHALREEGDATAGVGLASTFLISIHALREEGDIQSVDYKSRHRDFNPRPPRGGRQRHSRLAQQYDDISIHALREEGDLVQV